jgi:ectoine hydroxylase-related dioxygenase (phytanoyl-CoA dioxygenase family)
MFNEAEYSMKLTCNGRDIDTSPDRFGWLCDSSSLLNNDIALRERMACDGYLYLPGFLKSPDIQAAREAAREAVCQILADDDKLNLAYDINQAVSRPDSDMRLRMDIGNQTRVSHFLDRIVSSKEIMNLYRRLLGGPAKHYKCMWLRTMTSKNGAAPHCDIVFFGRGTQNLLTAWVPLGNIPLSLGGLFVLEGSHKNEYLRSTYCTMDIDIVCTNLNNKSQMNVAGYPGTGALSMDTAKLQEDLQCRLLTALEYKIGDLLTFSACTVHGSFDNTTPAIRLSFDTRFQLENEPFDERYLDSMPLPRMMKGTIC